MCEFLLARVEYLGVVASGDTGGGLKHLSSERLLLLLPVAAWPPRKPLTAYVYYFHNEEGLLPRVPLLALRINLYSLVTN